MVQGEDGAVGEWGGGVQLDTPPANPPPSPTSLNTLNADKRRNSANSTQGTEKEEEPPSKTIHMN